MGFDRNVFVNCPFDDDYKPLLQPLLFTIFYLGLNPRIALESLDSGRPRFEKIVALIRESRYGIHDLSRLQASYQGELFRLNMPFELGLDVGCRLFQVGADRKRCLILETERYRFQAAISDLSSSDIASHKNDPKTLMKEVRDWLNIEAGLSAPGPSRIWDAYLDFQVDDYDARLARGFSERDMTSMPVAELIASMRRWCRRRQS
jgi:hypothetical protein